METRIVLASHGKFASGILSSLKLLYGNTESVTAMDCYIDPKYDLQKNVKKVIDENSDNRLLVITDILGGSVNNEFLKYIKKSNFYLVSGLNLPFLLELMTQITETSDLELLIKNVLDNSKESIQFCNESIKRINKEEDF
ncbi:PTS sugar transporter subunit IIA [Companilactobacillus kimchii]|uniref:PTS permease n=2 Tax=Companilactobacillus kimchii TaxID=2801452 RepID=A0ABR5NW16_9LACO|nr:PTS mannose transporter subunit IIA [Companilactobacillus kimchii]KAE9559686.1 PTS mannose transporter subunit IIA [Companilactobacillus kimchii]KRK52979.1 PTS permease [Companilactobacillus kimchii DSM 13961 = JCM 10707]OWF32114.1 Protein-N(pi)-phosphohistidine--sugar phosphotransferase [Companilactobacillus kimchii]GEO47938.1 PTS mannose transporter subunit IIA [Companilactobacillus paralimentarius]